ncbi:hypothetical protein JTE90_000606 [Oedothorax gibbosus]|uniref:Enoyl-[acyl-carrier-protein] reductase, mitochondrial n=1 Tax=Oedothorax gibbosus TaxID=931172 RepID=A0AAV6VWE3_9ARAC|nr:hypothetical protein JTE90_000606 [Oedothorax gibbosus]
MLRFLSKTNFRVSQCSSLSSYALQYKEHGDPSTVLEKVELDLADNLESDQVLVKTLAAPVNPADINMVQGKYALKPKLPAVGGNEGVSEVIKVGPSVKNLKVGSWVIPYDAGKGTWRTHTLCREEEVIQVDETIPLTSAATISVNPCTAYRMLKDFENLKEDRPDFESLRSHLMNLGATHVVVENELRSPVMTDIFKEIPKPSLGLNCVGGKSVSELIRNMKDKGTIVTYGGMSKQPIALSTASLIFNDMRIVGFWMTRWSQQCSIEERKSMLQEITSIMKKGCLRPPVSREVKFDNFKDAIAKAMEPYVSEKQILVMD